MSMALYGTVAPFSDFEDPEIGESESGILGYGVVTYTEYNLYRPI